ncbi:hypothetical protein NBRC116599_37480 [Aquicoccus sp. SU-CL01552]
MKTAVTVVTPGLASPFYAQHTMVSSKHKNYEAFSPAPTQDRAAGVGRGPAPQATTSDT